MRFSRSGRSVPVLGLAAAVAFLLGASGSLLGTCGPFADVTDPTFCSFVLEIFYLGITTGTTPTTYDPSAGVSRLQMSAFLSRSVDGVLKRGSRRAALARFWTPQTLSAIATTTVGALPRAVKSDGVDLWVANFGDLSVSRVRGADGLLLQTWTGALGAFGALTAMNRVFVTGFMTPGALYRIDPTLAAGAVTTVATNLGGTPSGMDFDGSRIWTANLGGNSVSIVTPGATLPWTVTTVTTGFAGPAGVVFDGANVWVTDNSAGKVYKLDANGSILQTVTVGGGPGNLIYDGTSFWVPNSGSGTVSVVRASSGALLATLTGNGLMGATTAAFDGERILVTDFGGNRVSLWKAADLSPLGFISTGPSTQPGGACSDGVSFWVALQGTGQLARF
jgi:DNA-binding beta-propeller fold protein YncE